MEFSTTRNAEEPFSGGEGENGDDGFNSPQPPPLPPFLPGAGAPSTIFNVPDWLVLQMQPITMSDLQVAMDSVHKYGKSIISAASETLSPISDKFAEIFPNGVTEYLRNPLIYMMTGEDIAGDEGYVSSRSSSTRASGLHSRTEDDALNLDERNQVDVFHSDNFQLTPNI